MKQSIPANPVGNNFSVQIFRTTVKQDFVYFSILKDRIATVFGIWTNDLEIPSFLSTGQILHLVCNGHGRSGFACKQSCFGAAEQSLQNQIS